MPTVKELVDEAFDKAMGLDADEKAKIAAAVKDLYPGRSEKTLANIAEYIKTLWVVGDLDRSRARLAELASADPLLTRRTPSVADIVAFKEAEAKRLGLSWDGAKRISAMREAEAMDDEARLALVPADFKLTPPVEAKPVIASAVSETEKLDAEILQRTGRDPRGMLVSERQRLHGELRKILAEPAPKAAASIPEQDLTNPERWRERVNAQRRAART